MCRCPSRMPGSVSISTSRSEARWASAKRSSCAWAKRMSWRAEGRDLVDAALDVALAQAEARRGPAVGPHRVVAHRLVAAPPHRVDDVGHRFGDLASAIVIGIDRA